VRHVLVDDAIGGFLQNPTEDSFVSVFQTLYTPLIRYFMVRGLDSSTAEELVQDVLLTVYRRSSDVRNHLCFSGWLFQVARNSLLQHARKRHAVLESLTGREGDERLLGQVTARFQLPEESQLFEWMQSLEEDEREICLMRYMDGLDYLAIADALHLPMGTVKWKLHQIKKKIAVRLAATHTGRKS
jgi:RNA polymerase sigma-70 factor (ECF subfamily)